MFLLSEIRAVKGRNHAVETASPTEPGEAPLTDPETRTTSATVFESLNQRFESPNLHRRRPLRTRYEPARNGSLSSGCSTAGSLLRQERRSHAVETALPSVAEHIATRKTRERGNAATRRGSASNELFGNAFARAFAVTARPVSASPKDRGGSRERHRAEHSCVCIHLSSHRHSQTRGLCTDSREEGSRCT
jgi:hypothetical protein